MYTSDEYDEGARARFVDRAGQGRVWQARQQIRAGKILSTQTACWV